MEPNEAHVSISKAQAISMLNTYQHHYDIDNSANNVNQLFYDFDDDEVVQNIITKNDELEYPLISHSLFHSYYYAKTHIFIKNLCSFLYFSVCLLPLYVIIPWLKIILFTNTSIKGVFLLCILVNFITCSFLEVTSGGYHTCALSDSSEAKCFGYNTFGQLGYSDTNSRGDEAGEMSNLSVIGLGPNFNIKQIATGYRHTCALSENNSMKCWGSNEYGKLGYGDTINRGDIAGDMGDALPFINLGSGFDIIQITTGKEHTCVLSDSSAVKCWGYNKYGSLGYNDTLTRGHTSATTPNNLPPIDLGTNFDAIQITRGHYTDHTCALSSSGSIKCWGRNHLGQLGYGDVDNRGDEPNEMGDALQEVDLGTNFTVKQIVTGFRHTCALSHSHQEKSQTGRTSESAVFVK